MHLTFRCLQLSSADMERALISNYKKLVCSSRVTLCDESVQVLHSTLMGVFQAIKNEFLSSVFIPCSAVYISLLYGEWQLIAYACLTSSC